MHRTISTSIPPSRGTAARGLDPAPGRSPELPHPPPPAPLRTRPIYGMAPGCGAAEPLPGCSIPGAAPSRVPPPPPAPTRTRSHRGGAGGRRRQRPVRAVAPATQVRGEEPPAAACEPCAGCRLHHKAPHGPRPPHATGDGDVSSAREPGTLNPLRAGRQHPRPCGSLRAVGRGDASHPGGRAPRVGAMLLHVPVLIPGRAGGLEGGGGAARGTHSLPLSPHPCSRRGWKAPSTGKRGVPRGDTYGGSAVGPARTAGGSCCPLHPGSRGEGALSRPWPASPAVPPPRCSPLLPAAPRRSVQPREGIPPRSRARRGAGTVHSAQGGPRGPALPPPE